MRLARAIVTVGAGTGVSRLTGFLRDVLIAASLGAGPIADAFFVAFKLANLLRRLFAEGAFAAAFVPLFSGILHAQGSAAARRFAEEALAALGLVLLLVVVAAELLMPLLVRVLAPGFAPGELRFELAVELSRITFPYLLAISLAALISGALNGLGRFAAAAFAPVLLNVALIAAILVARHTGLPIAPSLAWGVALAGLLQLAWVWAALALHGMPLRPRRPRRGEPLRRLGRLLGPGILGAGVHQLSLLIDTWFASFLAAGAVSWLFYADRLVQLPLGLVGIAIGTALLPALVRRLRTGELEPSRRLLDRGLESALLVSLPAAAGLIALAQPIVQALFERGAFTAGDTAATAGALAAFALGLPAFVCNKVLAPAFFAREDTATPVKIALVALGANVLLIALLIGPLGHVGIALATALAAWLNTLLLARGLRRAGALALGPRLRAAAVKLALAAMLMGAAVWLLHPALAGLGRLSALLLTIAVGGALFAVLASLAGCLDRRELRAAFLAGGEA